MYPEDFTTLNSKDFIRSPSTYNLCRTANNFHYKAPQRNLLHKPQTPQVKTPFGNNQNNQKQAFH